MNQYMEIVFLFYRWLQNLLSSVNWRVILEETYVTLYMLVITTIFVGIFGLLLGLILFLTEEDNLLGNKYINWILSFLVNIFRSIPFIILIVLLIPVTKTIVGTITGKEAALPALIIGAIPFYARIVELALKEINKGVIEAARAMGATTTQIIVKVLIPEAKPAIISGLTVSAIAILGYTAMATVVGSGGLGYLAVNQGFARSRHAITLIATLICVVIVIVLQLIGDILIRKIDKR